METIEPIDLKSVETAITRLIAAVEAAIDDGLRDETLVECTKAVGYAECVLERTIARLRTNEQKTENHDGH